MATRLGAFAPRSLNFGRVLWKGSEMATRLGAFGASPHLILDVCFGKEVKWPQGSAPSAPRSLNFGRVLWKGSEMATRLGAFGASLT
jgi:hypothetical protein